MKPNSINIICFGIQFFCNLIRIFFLILENIYERIKHNVYYFFIMNLYYRNEYIYINQMNKDIIYPKNIAIIIPNIKYHNNHICVYVMNIINWVLLTKSIQYLTIYDPFNIIKNNELFNLLSNIKDKKITISYRDEKSNNPQLKIVNSSSSISDLHICLLKYSNKNNEEYIKDCIINKRIYNNYPKEYDIFFNKKDIKVIDHNNIHYTNFYIRKKEISLPELILVFNYSLFYKFEDICLYGFPFGMLENAEIFNVNYKNFDKIDCIDFINIFKNNMHTQKRFGK